MDLGFDQLDELAFVAAAGAVNQRPIGLSPKNLGAIIELYWLLQEGFTLPSLDDLVTTRRLQMFRTIVSGKLTACFEDDASSSRLIRCYWDSNEEPDDWYYFCKAIQKAAIAAKLPTKNAQELVAATRELVANIYDHSNASKSGIVGFSTSPYGLEIVIADQGIGVLESLRTSAEFSSLRDSGEALEAALIDGTSRFGKTSGHGGGFRALFRGLINISSALRFRSGNHALDISGISPGAGTGRISQKVQLSGFVVSISCTP